ncbi:ComF family protein [Slackia isoflavoniconvertens]|uniref:ComF family protein n=1 Tax=Slackia isoflavoniconvertens TaxID=572010 RepID=UPI002EB623E3|nr:phosphoribosyltransferase family protein [Slackia isoflavoniconvertens]
MQGRFTVCEPLTGRRLILIDDVFTTGATMDQASIALEHAGAQVRCATVARA